MAKMNVVEVDGLRRYMKGLGPEATQELREASLDIADQIAGIAAQEAISVGHPTAVFVAGTIRATRDRIPTMKMGGSQKLPPHSDGRARRGRRQTVGDVMWGAEYGSAKHTQFPQWRGNGEDAGYFLWPTVRRESGWMLQQWSIALKDALNKAPTR